MPSTRNTLTSAIADKDILSVTWADGHESRFHAIWLRHQCWCEACGTPVTGVRGIRLNDIFRPKDKKKIAFAARKGDKQRRSAISQHAGRQVERVRQRLRGNLELMTLARDFLALEESDALNALENTHASNKNASPRLATYLLLDAAVT